jgi:hypothetical protein
METKPYNRTAVGKIQGSRSNTAALVADAALHSPVISTIENLWHAIGLVGGWWLMTDVEIR